jgi:hypothetical protein
MLFKILQCCFHMKHELAIAGKQDVGDPRAFEVLPQPLDQVQVPAVFGQPEHLDIRLRQFQIAMQGAGLGLPWSSTRMMRRPLRLARRSNRCTRRRMPQAVARGWVWCRNNPRPKHNAPKAASFLFFPGVFTASCRPTGIQQRARYGSKSNVVASAYQSSKDALA